MAWGRRTATAAIVWLTLAGAPAACGGGGGGPSAGAGCRSDGPSVALAQDTRPSLDPAVSPCA